MIVIKALQRKPSVFTCIREDCNIFLSLENWRGIIATPLWYSISVYLDLSSPKPIIDFGVGSSIEVDCYNNPRKEAIL